MRIWSVMYRPKTRQNLQLLPWKSKQWLFPSFIIRSKIWILFTFANTRSGYAWVQLIHCSSLFTTKQTAAACSLQLSPNSLVGAIYWVINSSDSVITTAFAQIKVEREKDLKKKKEREFPLQRRQDKSFTDMLALSEDRLTKGRQDWHTPGWGWLGTASSRQETHGFIWNYKPEFQKAQTTLKPSKLDILYFK